MITFDNVLDDLEEIFARDGNIQFLSKYKKEFFVNRDLRGRVAIVFNAESLEKMNEQDRSDLTRLCNNIADKLGDHTISSDRMPIEAYPSFIDEKKGAVLFTYGEKLPFTVADRMLVESTFSQRADEDELSAKMIAFFSIKGGVGRSTALAAAAWHLAKLGKKVLVVDMDLESPGLSSTLLPGDRRPDYGLLDLLVEDVLDNSKAVFDNIYAKSPLADNSPGEIEVIPAHGKNYDNYIAKMGRALMPKFVESERISWPKRLNELLHEFDRRHQTDYVLIDARAGLSEIASVSILDLAPKLVLLFALEGKNTWTDYSILFKHWKNVGQTRMIRSSLQMVAAMIPQLEDKRPYIQSLRENAWNCFQDYIYDDLSAGSTESNDSFTFDFNDMAAPHNPWCIHWNQSLYAMKQLDTLEDTLDENLIRATFQFLENLDSFFIDKKMKYSVPNLQKALMAATENLSTAAENDDDSTLAKLFTPLSHLQALRLKTSLVIGARGVGKTFWTQALQKEAIREVLKKDIPELAGLKVAIGHSNKMDSNAYPGSEIFVKLLHSYKPTAIWRTVWLRALATQIGVNFPCPCKLNSWLDDVAAVEQDPEAVDKFFFEANEVLAANNKRFLVLFDALDRVANSWQDIDILTTGLLQTTLQLSTFSHIKGKIFLREDHYNRLTFSFPDASKLLSTRVELTWKRADLYSLLWQNLCNSVNKNGEILRDLLNEFLPNSLQQEGDIWLLNRTPELTDDNLRNLFHTLTGPYMGKDRRRGIPYVWMVGHLADARQQTSPRSFLDAIRNACEDSCNNHSSTDYAIHFESIKKSVQHASKTRIKEMEEDNPWIVGLLNPLKGLSVPLKFDDVRDIWEKEYPQGPSMLISEYEQHIPPEFKSMSWPEVRDLLMKLGFCMTLSDGRFNMPDLYRVGFGLGRRGGVKPLK